MFEGDELKMKINCLREVLDSILEKENDSMLVKDGLLKLSKELDELIVNYTRWKKENNV